MLKERFSLMPWLVYCFLPRLIIIMGGLELTLENQATAIIVGPAVHRRAHQDHGHGVGGGPGVEADFHH